MVCALRAAADGRPEEVIDALRNDPALLERGIKGNEQRATFLVLQAAAQRALGDPAWHPTLEHLERIPDDGDNRRGKAAAKLIRDAADTDRLRNLPVAVARRLFVTPEDSGPPRTPHVRRRR